MPEIAELKLMSEFVNDSCKNKTFNCVGISEVTKLEKPIIKFDEFTIEATSRGKEMKLTLNCTQDPEFETLIMSMGMTGSFVVSDEIPQHCHLWFKETYSGEYLCFVDPRRFGGWKQQNDWSSNRGPDPTEEFVSFIDGIIKAKQAGKHKSKKLYEILMDQKLFNGVGNYLRAEILYRFYQSNHVSPSRTFGMTKLSDLKALCFIVRKVCFEAYEIGGGEIQTWENPNGESSKEKFDAWLQCYRQDGMKSLKDKQGRTFWYTPESIKKVTTEHS